MLRYIILLMFSVFVSFTIQAQEAKPSLTIHEVTIEDNARSAKNIKGKLSKRLKKNYDVVDNGFLKLSSYVTLGKMHVINGMDTYTTTEATVDYEISGSGLPVEKLQLAAKCKGKNERDLISKIGNSIIRDSKHVNALQEFIDGYLDKHLTSCSQVTQQINSLLAGNEISSAFDMLGYYNWLGNCEEDKATAEKAIEDKHASYACQVVIQKCSILANSPELDDLNEAIDILQMVPPDAPCAEEAIKVSEKIAENGAKLSSYAAKKLEDRIVVINSLNQSDWRTWYRKNHTRIYRR